MNISKFARVICVFVAGILLLAVNVARSESIVMALGEYPLANEAMGRISDHPELMHEEKSPTHRYTRFAVRGESADNWEEALEVLDLFRDPKFQNASEWFKEFKASTRRDCEDWIVHTEGQSSVTYERDASGCPESKPEHSMSRVLFGKSNVFVVSGTVKGKMDEPTRSGWLALLSHTGVADGDERRMSVGDDGDSPPATGGPTFRDENIEWHLKEDSEEEAAEFGQAATGKWIHSSVAEDFPSRLVCYQEDPRLMTVKDDDGEFVSDRGDDSRLLSFPWKPARYEIINGRPLMFSPFDAITHSEKGYTVKGGQWTHGDLQDGGYIYASPENTFLLSSDFKILLSISFNSARALAVRRYVCSDGVKDQGEDLEMSE